MANPAQREEGSRALAAAVAPIEKLVFNSSSFALTTTVLWNLAVVPTSKLNFLSVAGTALQAWDEDLSNSIKRLLECSSTVEGLLLVPRTAQIFRGSTFRPVAQAIINSTSLTEFGVGRARFDDEATLVFQNILRNKPNLSILCLSQCIFGVDNERADNFHESLKSALVRPESSLRLLMYSEHEENQRREPENGERFSALTRAVAKSKLEIFLVQNITRQQQIQALNESIPFMRGVKEVVIETCPPLVDQMVKQGLLRAVGRNFSLRTVKAQHAGAHLFRRDEEKRVLAFYANRNERLDGWVDETESVDRKLWPEALSLAQQAGQDKLYKSLQGVLGSDYVNLRLGRKRNRTQFYDPSGVPEPTNRRKRKNTQP